MKRSLLILSLMICLKGKTLGQDTIKRNVDIGIDLLKSVWPLAGVYPDLRTAYTLEPTLMIQLNKSSKYIHITPGFTSFTAKPNIGRDSSRQSGHGYYLKVGYEKREQRVGIGAAMLLSMWKDEETYRLHGSYFGDYTGIIPQQTRVAVGSEFFVGGLLPISQRFALRIQFRVSIIAPYTSHSDRFVPAYLPGVGLLAGSDWVISSGITLQLFFRAAPK